MSIELLDRQDDFSRVRNAIRRMASERNDYAGCPIPLDNQRLIIEPTFKYKGLGDIDSEEPQDGLGLKVRNVFFSTRLGCRIAICEEPEGSFWWAPFVGSATQATALLNTIGAADVWGIEQEHNAVQLLGSMLRHRQLKQYLLTGMFLEKSVRSELMYMFRRLKPTLVMSDHSGGVKILAGLCMHPIGYYEESWAGCMCPTDDVIAHLILMRGDEHLFWKRCAQHEPCDPACGV